MKTAVKKPPAMYHISTSMAVPGPPPVQACGNFSDVAAPVVHSAALSPVTAPCPSVYTPAAWCHPDPSSAYCRQLRPMQGSMNARTPSSSSVPAPREGSSSSHQAAPSPGRSSTPPQDVRPSSPCGSSRVSPGSSPTATSAYTLPAHTMSGKGHHPHTQEDNSSSPGPTSPRSSPLMHNATMPWKKRSLRHNFHSIEDLVRPGDNFVNPGAVTSGYIHRRPLATTTNAHYLQDRHGLMVATSNFSSSSLPRPARSREERCSAPGSTPPGRPSPVCAVDNAASDDDDDIDVVDTVETRLSPAPYTPPSSTCEGNPHTPPDSSTASPSMASPSRVLPGEAGARDQNCDSPGGARSAAAASSNSSSATPGGGDPETADPNRLRKGRTIYKAQQVYILEQVFSRTHYPDPEVIETLSRELDISENKIKVWFQNKRARWRRRAAETGLPPQPIGFTLTGTPGMPPSWPHPASLPAGVLMPQPMYSSPFAGGQMGGPRPGFPMTAFPGLNMPPLYLSFDSGMLHAAAKGLSHPSVMPYSGYPMSVLPNHTWGEPSKLPGT